MGLLTTLAERRRRFRPSSAPQISALCHALLSERGEVSGSRVAAQAVAAYQALSDRGIEQLLTLLSKEFSPDAERVWAAAKKYHADPAPGTLLQLQNAVEPPRQELFRRINMAPGGTRVLVDLRQRLLPTLPEHEERASVDADLLHLFRSWFNRGFLVLQRIDWHTPAVVLERLIQKEAVHEIQGWRDLRRRLEADRRCYGFFHPALPDEPLIFIEVALTRGMPAAVQLLLDQQSPITDPEQADHAVFYSITNCEEGLRGVWFGNFLIKQVAEDLSREFPNLRTFATLSPVPGFRAWLASGDGERSSALQRLLAAPADPGVTVPAALQDELTLLCAHYLINVKRRDHAPLDSVARFHLANGASLQQINWMGDSSPAGIRRSFGLTANYGYRLDELEQNHEAYAREFRVVAAPALARMAARGERTAQKGRTVLQR